MDKNDKVQLNLLREDFKALFTKKPPELSQEDFDKIRMAIIDNFFDYLESKL